MSRFRAIRRDERGATAIEYAIIGALIGIGLIGSLVGTKTSLNAIFGMASGQMGSANGGSTNPVTQQRAIAAASTSARAPYWNAKTLASKVVTNPTPTSQLTKFTYTDGAYGSYLANYDSSGKLLSEVVISYPMGYSGRTMDSLQFTYGADGAQQAMVYLDRYANGSTHILETASAAGGWANYYYIYDTNGNVTGQGPDGTTAPIVTSTSAADEIYFRALSQ